jgi:hypothetical protein
MPVGCFLLTSSACWLGVELVSLFVYSDVDFFTRLGIGMPCGVVLMGWVFYFFNLYFEFSRIFGFTVMIVFAVVALILHVFVKRIGIPPKIPLLNLLLSVFVPTLFLCWFIFISMLYDNAIVRGAVYGDLPFHLNLITSFVYGCNKNRPTLFGNLSPFFANEPLAYPIIPDFISALMVGCFDTSLRWSLVIPSFPFVYSLFAVLARIVALFSKNLIAVLIAPWLFLFVGGLGFTTTFNFSVLRDLNADMVHSWGNQRYEYWFHPILHVLLPQRLSLFSMPICWSYIFLMLKKGRHWRKFLLCGLIVALLPQVQGHSLITLVEWTFAFALLNFPWQIRKWKKEIRNYVILGIPAIGLGVPQLLPFIGRVAKTKFVTFVPIWADDKITFWGLWWRGLGVFWAVSLCHCWTTMDLRQARIYLPSLFVFGLSNFIHYQPWNLDNTKVFYNGWVPLAVAAVCNFLSRMRKNRFEVIVAVIIFFACTLSSALGLLKALGNGAPLFETSDAVPIAKWAMKHSPPKSVWVTDSHHNHPIPMLAGRQILVGYRGWLPSHHLDEKERVWAMEALGKNQDDTRKIDSFSADFLCFDLANSDELNFRFNARSAKWKLAYRNQRYEVWNRTGKPTV